MQCDTKQHHTYGGIDLHARTMSGCIRTQAGEMLLHQHMQDCISDGRLGPCATEAAGTRSGSAGAKRGNA
jgi:hypothetical protein